MLEVLSAALDKSWDFFNKGGVLAWPILACSLVALAVIIERWWTYRRVSRSGGAWFEEALDRLGRGDPAGVAQALAGTAHPSGRVLAMILDKVNQGRGFSRDSLEKLASHYGTKEVNALERWLPALATIGNVAPLLGLMGTVLGMVKAFMKIEALQGKVNAAVLAGGIWEALLTTLFGLAVAIPAVLAHNWLSAKLNRIAGEIQDQAVTFLDALEEANEPGLPCGEEPPGPAAFRPPAHREKVP